MNDDMRAFLDLTGALADETRLRVLLALGRGELCVCQITELLGLAPSTVSKHLSVLHHAGLVESRKEGRWIHYRLAPKDASVAVKEALDWVKKSLARSERALSDAKLLAGVLRCDPAELCRRQCRR